MANEPVNFLGDALGMAQRYALAIGEIHMAKALVDANDNEFGLQIDGINSGIGIKDTTTMGSAGLTSIWRSTDMFWIAGASILVLGAYLIAKK